MKKIFALFIIVLSVLTAEAQTETLPETIFDKADMIDDSSLTIIKNNIINFYDSTKIALIIVAGEKSVAEATKKAESNALFKSDIQTLALVYDKEGAYDIFGNEACDSTFAAECEIFFTYIERDTTIGEEIIVFTGNLFYIESYSKYYNDINKRKGTLNYLISRKDVLRNMNNDPERKETIIAHALMTPAVDSSIKIYDYAHLFSSEEKIMLLSELKEVYNNIKLDICILTTNKCLQETTDDLCMDFYHYNDFGYGPTHDGICLVIDMENRHYRYYDSGKPTDITFCADYDEEWQDLIGPYLTEGNYYAGVSAWLMQAENDYKYENSFPVYKCLLFSLIITLIVISIMLSKHREIHKEEYVDNYVNKNEIYLTYKKDEFISSHTTCVYNPPSKGSGGGIGSSGICSSGGGGSF